MLTTTDIKVQALKISTDKTRFISVKSTYVGGLIAYAENAKITACETDGYYKQTDIGFDIYIGGILGFGKQTNIISSGSNMQFELKVKSTQGSYYIGYIVGYLQGDVQTHAIIDGCYSNVYEVGKEQTDDIVAGELITNIGMCGATKYVDAKNWSKEKE